MGIQVRQLRTDDFDADILAAIMHESVHGVASSHYSAEERAAWSPAPRTGQEAADRFAGQTLFLAEDENGPSAFMTLTDDGYLDFAYALPRAKGQGVATRVYTALEKSARKAGHERLTSDISLAAFDFFERRGWRPLKRNAIQRGEVTLYNFAMEKVLA